MTGRMTAPGDLGRRVIRRREELGLSREQLAERAGIDPGYLAYLEETPASPTAETVSRIAAALDAGVDDLLGGTMDLPPGQGGPGPRPRLEKLDDQECLRLLSPGGVGRVAFNDAGGPAILPVNYVLHDDAVVFRTAFGSPLDESLHTGVQGVDFKVAFQVDRIDEANREGWSVLVRGGAHHASSPEERAAMETSGVQPWAGGERALYVRIVPSEITGRRIRNAT
ncbi:nitroimidazol reductase NimA-like FMN-containing flavoprotein (pyridoxamine 5'-phosphate oxidase superfamily)/DNA-binding XRE family transcriptional regulator [Streptosporangium becharense]|uniref:Nitroimidazol reductase NimA-like FMN-containing flavoprotein (Pyridoxamine 5'-phosphate oxidase superfamily)/DNA-binding XRE family transcriptional regulator n=1 Tax=Streptosporangium becharense TaxID=1816182 RepID=A0A7W9ME85_9ACTN|nr:pyridoxamine 5'-phosphate oxidase family protein [Streptosporangium becharense]MBB2910845.1 nitroimidazol reductase NimA-like FMN-containing flavoprotein (pyridoxamine 5'-phosphate oxidase superfamily)/DNA-binding XRE family transcriptional regulator [Streptosporangium becharense]MBB5817540.1 nitroimidazol reductase NimA-like FMN-containing flavoprotein (pyridoxamine 5'-phosphate oxidase superfamily)/DNA-binding XRE family transcriptional regulator [Streptosporangium becharense]